MNSVKSINPIKSMIQTIYDIIKAYCGEIKVKKRKVVEGFIIQSSVLMINFLL